MRKTPLMVLGLLLAGLMITTSCGKKGPPFIPERTFDLTVTNLQGEGGEGYFLLTGDIPGFDHAKGDGRSITGCRVYYADYPVDRPPCADCPIEYQGYHRFGPEVITAEGFTCRIPGKTEGRIHFFRVYLTGPDGAMGPPSKRVQVLPVES